MKAGKDVQRGRGFISDESIPCRITGENLANNIRVRGLPPQSSSILDQALRIHSDYFRARRRGQRLEERHLVHRRHGLPEYEPRGQGRHHR